MLRDEDPPELPEDDADDDDFVLDWDWDKVMAAGGESRDQPKDGLPVGDAPRRRPRTRASRRDRRRDVPRLLRSTNRLHKR